MATQRYISTSFWDDNWIQTLDPSEKLLFLYYMTNPLTNIAGVYKISVRRISFDTGFTSDTIGHIMAKFQVARKVFRFGEYIILPSWPLHQKWESKSKIKDGIIAVLSQLDKETLYFITESGYKFDMKLVFDMVSIPYPYDRNYSEFEFDSDRDIDLPPNPQTGNDEGFPQPPKITVQDFSPAPVVTSTPPQSGKRFQHSPSEVNGFFATWNACGMPEFRKLLLNVPNAGQLLEALSFYSGDEITQAIRAYATIQTDPAYEMGFQYQTVITFLTKGLEAFAPGAKPLERYARKSGNMTDEQKAAAQVARVLAMSTTTEHQGAQA